MISIIQAKYKFLLLTFVSLFTALLMCTPLSLGHASAESLNRILVMSLDANDTNPTAYSLDQSYSIGGYYSGWVKQISQASNPYVVKVGGDRIMALLNDGTLLTKDSIYSNWVTQTTGVQWIDIGANSEMMIINSAGNVYSKKGLYDPWVQQTSGGGARDIAVGGNGRLMVIDSASNAYSKESTYDAWIKQVDGARSVGVGSTGRMVVVNGDYEVYYKDAPTLDWNIIYRSNYPNKNYSFWININ